MKMRVPGIVKNQIILLFVILLSLLHPAAAFAGSETDLRQPVKLEYFYLNPCGSCDEEGEFRKKLDQLMGEEIKDFSLQLIPYNTFRETDSKLFDKYCRNYGIPEEKKNLPALFVNGRLLSGEAEIDVKLKDILMEQKQAVISELLYFHVTSCGECDKVSEFLGTLDSKYTVETGNKTTATTVSIRRLNVEEPENLELVRTLYRQYAVPEEQQEVPAIFFKGGYLAGEAAIRQSLVSEITQGKAVGAVAAGAGENAAGALGQGLNGYQAAGVFFTGLLNGLNPCSISMLLFFVSLILVKQYNILKLGISFILGKLIAYTLLGTILFSVLLKVGGWFHSLQSILKILLIVIGLLLAFINFLDYLAAKNEKYGNIRLQLPRRLREINHFLAKKLTSPENAKFLLPASFLLGIVISAGEFLCTGQIYLATIVYILKSSPTLDLQAVGYFLLYGLALVLPLLGLTILIHKGRELFDVSEFVRARMHGIKLANVLFFLIFVAVVVLFF